MLFATRGGQGQTSQPSGRRPAVSMRTRHALHNPVDATRPSYRSARPRRPDRRLCGGRRQRLSPPRRSGARRLWARLRVGLVGARWRQHDRHLDRRRTVGVRAVTRDRAADGTVARGAARRGGGRSSELEALGLAPRERRLSQSGASADHQLTRGVLWLLAPDVSALRESRDLRLVVLGNFVSGMGTQATLVALPYQIYVETHSALLVGLLGAVELVPLIASALWGGAMADRMDRRTLLLLDQIGLVLVAAALAAVSFAGDPSIAVLYVLAGLLAGVSALQNVV